MEKYEIVSVSYPDYPHLSDIATLTGLSIEEIKPVTDSHGVRWRGKTYIDVFQQLGFNTNPRFVKFDPETKYPALIRCTRKDDRYWYSLVYYDQVIYCSGDQHLFSHFTRTIKSGSFVQLNDKPYKITSMLQVWI